MMKGNRTAGERAQHHQHYLKGSLFCGHCGAKMALTHSKGRNKIYQYFYCLGRNKNRTDCEQGFVAVASVEQARQHLLARTRPVLRSRSTSPSWQTAANGSCEDAVVSS